MLKTQLRKHPEVLLRNEREEKKEIWSEWRGGARAGSKEAHNDDDDDDDDDDNQLPGNLGTSLIASL